jgi:hypothetical protein
MDTQTSQPKDHCFFEFRISDCDNRASRRLMSLPAAAKAVSSPRRFRRSLQHQICLASAAAWCALAPSRLVAPGHRASEAVATRQLAMYLAHVVFAQPLASAGAMVRRDRGTARHACWRMEEHREDRQFDRALAHIEQALRSWTDVFGAGEQP